MKMTEINSFVIVGRSDSKCNHCGRAADCTALAHDVLLGYGPDNGQPGCGAKFLFCVDSYLDPKFIEGMKYPIPRRDGL